MGHGYTYIKIRLNQESYLLRFFLIQSKWSVYGTSSKYLVRIEIKKLSSAFLLHNLISTDTVQVRGGSREVCAAQGGRLGGLNKVTNI